MKIAIVKLSALGDIIHAMVVLQYIKKFNQNIKIDWIVDEHYYDILSFNKDINKIHLKNDIQPTDDLVDLLLSSSKTSL